jgi:hypothetical protein
LRLGQKLLDGLDLVLLLALEVADLVQLTFVLVVDEVAARTVRTEARRMESPTALRLVLGMTIQVP